MMEVGLIKDKRWRWDWCSCGWGLRLQSSGDLGVHVSYWRFFRTGRWCSVVGDDVFSYNSMVLNLGIWKLLKKEERWELFRTNTLRRVVISCQDQILEQVLGNKSCYVAYPCYLGMGRNQVYPLHQEGLCIF